MSDPRVRLADALRERYVIERELGAGGMATVYLAQDLKAADTGSRLVRIENSLEERTGSRAP